MCTSPVLVSVEELQREVAEITRDKVNPQEPPSQLAIVASDQPQEQSVQDIATIVDTLASTHGGEKAKEQPGQIDTSISTAQTLGAPPHITVIDQGSSQEEKKGVKTTKEQEAIQALVNLPTFGIPQK